MLSFENMSHMDLGPQVTTVSQLSSLREEQLSYYGP